MKDSLYFFLYVKASIGGKSLIFFSKFCTLVLCSDYEFFLANFHSHMHGVLKLPPTEIKLRTKLIVMTKIS